MPLFLISRKVEFNSYLTINIKYAQTEIHIGRDHPDIGVIIALSQFECQEQFSENHRQRRALPAETGMTWFVVSAEH